MYFLLKFLILKTTDPYHNLAVEEYLFQHESDDVLISLLINKNPENIVIHNRHFMKKEVYDTISLIFGERVGNCNGCRLCTLLQ